MQSRIEERFSALAKKGERALVCYVVAGYPDLAATEKAVDSLVAGGADIIELGIPFSDPIADGPTIQQASHSALESGVTPDKALAVAKSIRKKHPDLPLLAMTYSNILVHAGMEKFMDKAKASGIDGFILPDMPVEEAGEYLKSARERNLATVFLASPNTSEQRLKEIVENSSGFMYLVSVYGITGARKNFEDYTVEAIKRTRQAAGGRIPVGVGFGISKPEHARFMANAGADAIIVGSAIVDRMSGPKGKMQSSLKSFAASLKKALRG
ncbi:tryptophan synthase subunit alpha [Nitrososphaera sp.]|uniref:tryptophan synthase subunit alpha n=1 Tax=Nitrososphaera sp. TaxID=1971748 RepID=UPI0031765B06